MAAWTKAAPPSQPLLVRVGAAPAPGDTEIVRLLTTMALANLRG